MPGGLLNIVAYGAANIILNGNPSKTFLRRCIRNTQILVFNDFA